MFKKMMAEPKAGKNYIARKLTCYFAVCLLVFAIIMGVVFMALFRSHTMELHKNELAEQAQAIANTLSQFETQHGGGYGAYLRFLNDISLADVWLIDENMELVTLGQGHHQSDVLTYKDLPLDGDNVIDQVFAGKVAFSQSFSQLLSQPTITVGTPVYRDEKVVGVVLLHAPVAGAEAAVAQGFVLLGISLGVALLICLLLSLWLSKNFTDPIISKEAAEALRLEKLRRDFIANISHELKTPVAVLRGSLEALTEEVVFEPTEVKAYHQEMLMETMYLQRLVGDVLDLSRLQNADFAIEKQELEFNGLVKDGVYSCQRLAAEKNVTIELHQSEEPILFMGDYGRLRQMLLILLDNAIKFSLPGDVVEIALTKACLEIKDQGVGINPQELPYLFERFYKSRSEENKTGTGLGLAIAKQIAQRHDLLITAKNNPQKGACFTIWFNGCF